MAAPSGMGLASDTPGAGGFSLSGIAIIAIRIFGAGLAFAAQALASRLVGADQFGYYTLAFVWLILLGHGATAGTNQLICRYLATYRERGDKNPAAGLLRFAFLMAATVAVAVALIAITVVQSGLVPVDPEVVAIASLAFMAVPILVLQDFLEAIARGMDRATLGIAPAMLVRHLALLIGAGALLLLGTDASALTIMSMTMAGLGVSVVIQTALLWKPLHAELKGAKPAYESAKWFRMALPIAVIDVAETLFNNADILILGLFMPPEIVAFYYAATRLAQFLGYVPYGISAVTQQKYAMLHERGDHTALQTLISAAGALSTTLAALGALTLTVIGGYLLLVFGSDYSAAYPVLPVLCLGIVFVCAFGPGEDVLTMLGHERVSSGVFVVFIAVNFALNFALVPQFGMMGAAIGTTATLGLRGAVLAWFAYKRTGLLLPFSPRRAHAAYLELTGKSAAAPAQRKPARPIEVEATVISGTELRNFNAQEWDDLVANEIEENPFIARHFVVAGLDLLDDPKSVRAVVLRSGGRLVGLLPFRTGRACGFLPFKQVQVALNAYQVHGAPLIRKGYGEAALNALFECRDMPGHWAFPHIDFNGPFARVMKRVANSRGLRTAQSCTYTRPILTRDENQSASWQKRRKKAARTLRRLRELGDVAFERATAPDAVATRLEQFLEMENSGWKGKRGTAFLARPSHAAFARRAFNAENGFTSIDSLLLDGKPIASVVNISTGPVLFNAKCAFDENYRKYGPGFILDDLAIEEFWSGKAHNEIDAATSSDGHVLLDVWNGTKAMGTLVVGPDKFTTAIIARVENLRYAGFNKLKQALERLSNLIS